MLEWLRRQISPKPEELFEILPMWEAAHGRPFFKPAECPFSAHVRAKGVVSRIFGDTRHDN